MIDYVIEYSDKIPYKDLNKFAEYLNDNYSEKFLFIPQEYVFKKFDLYQMIEIRDKMTQLIDEASI